MAAVAQDRNVLPDTFPSWQAADVAKEKIRVGGRCRSNVQSHWEYRRPQLVSAATAADFGDHHQPEPKHGLGGFKNG